MAVWDEPSLEACFDLNLPCWDAAALLPGAASTGGASGTADEAEFGGPDFLRIV